MNETVNHGPSNKAIAAHVRREAIAKAANTWLLKMNDEADIDLEAVLIHYNVIGGDDVIEYIEASQGDYLVDIQLEDGDMVTIDQDGNTMRGQAD